MRLPRLTIVGFALVGLALLAPVALGASGDVPTRIPDQSVYDLGGAFSSTAEHTAESILRAIHQAAGSDVVVVAEGMRAGTSQQAATARATVLRVGLEVGLETGDNGLLVFLGVEPTTCRAQVVLSATEGFPDAVLGRLAAERVVAGEMQPLILACDPDSALLVGLGRIATAITSEGASGPAANADGTGAGPPFPAPIDGVRVYDRAGVFRPTTIATAAATIVSVEQRTGAQIVVYSQVVEDGRTTEEADRDARALLDQWGVGRKGFDDGLVILFDLYPGLDHGQVILYGGPGYRASFLDNGEKQRIFDNDMLPRLKVGDFDGALLAAMARVDAAATPEHAATLERARQIDAAAGLVGAPLALLALVGSALWSWLRYGRDPAYLDDPSIHMAGPPATLTPAAAVFIQNGGPSRRALTTALIDLASRGLIGFRRESHLLGLRKKVGIETEPAAADPVVVARRRRNSARALGPAERIVADRLASLGRHSGGYIEPDHLPELAPSIPAFDRALEAEVVRNHWFREAPSKAVARWRRRGGIAVGAGIAGMVAGANIPSNGLLLIGGGILVGGAIVLAIAGSMPAVTLPGAMIRAMLAAYRRTLKKTMDQARSMDQVIAEAGLPWLETPDQAVVWGLALGLHHEIEEVMGRSLSDLQAGQAAVGSTYIPAWYGGSSGLGSGAFAGDFAGAAGGSGGLFSSGAVPDFGGMFAALGSIGGAPSSSGGGGGGGFGGGGSGGGGGGSGGGF